MAHAWKACWVQALGGSNPPSSATVIPVFSRDRDSLEIPWHSYRSHSVSERPGIPRIATMLMHRLYLGFSGTTGDSALIQTDAGVSMYRIVVDPTTGNSPGKG